MMDNLTDARNRLLPPDQLLQVAALLNMPCLDEAATTSDGASQTRQQAALYARIADWAQLSVQAAEQLGEPDEDLDDIRYRFAYLVEYTEKYAKGWSQAPGENTEGVELSAHAAETVAPTVLGRYITYLAEHRDEYQMWLVDSLSLRASVWNLDIAAHTRVRLPGVHGFPAHASTLQTAGVSPHAIEVRTPIQVHRLLDCHRAP
ncbi:hypothetical protein ITP53_00110 [Nonomuraea sp. K274]|uniref:Uncharacterized protein n=1 Tax=Nonomuraea cypriaca TaxID=1187855 RepID=A0A931EVH3_9ACTN|nr:hypothetical protein [Nonomuraea cypriaca]MBF8184175.1 hypothetical protein [Nonomuraea cypriaca]